jgi:hypothetical protein
MPSFERKPEEPVPPVTKPLEPQPSEANPTSSPAPLDHLRHTLGNQAMQDLVRSGSVLAKSDARPSADALEQQANRVAETLTNAPPATATSEAAPSGRRPTNAGPPRGTSSALPAEVEQTLGAGGQPLDPTIRRQFEHALGADLSKVEVHTGPRAGASAKAIEAQAYTAGHHVVFAEGQYRPGTVEGNKLLAHELTHVVQQRAQPNAPDLQRQPAQPPTLDQILADMAGWVVSLGTASDPPSIRSALQTFTSFGVPLVTIQFTRLTNARWVIGGLHIGAESRWPSGGSPEIAASDDLLRSFQLYQSNRQQHRDSGFAVIRTLAHELRHLQRQRQRDTGARGPTTAERRFEAEITRLAAATPAKLTPQEFAEVYTGRVLHAQVSYPVEEVFARLAEVEYVRREWVALRGRSGGPTQADRERMEDLLWEIGFRIANQVTMLRNTASQTTAGFTQTDFQISIREIETEITTRYGNNSPERRMWDLVVARRFHQSYAPQIYNLQPGGVPGGYQESYQTLVVVLPQVFP